MFGFGRLFNKKKTRKIYLFFLFYTNFFILLQQQEAKLDYYVLRVYEIFDKNHLE